MNRGTFYLMGTGAALVITGLVATPVCRPTFGEFLGANRDQKKRLAELMHEVNPEEYPAPSSNTNHHGSHGGHH
eukprot:gene684-845_t